MINKDHHNKKTNTVQNNNNNTTRKTNIQLKNNVNTQLIETQKETTTQTTVIQ